MKIVSDIIQITKLIEESDRKVWRFGELKHWDTLKHNNLLTLSLLDAKTNYSTLDWSTLKRGKRVLPRWVKALQRYDVVVLMDGEHYCGMAMVMLAYHTDNVKLQVGDFPPKPAIRIQWIHRLKQGVAHNFNIKTLNPDSFSNLDQLGFSLKETLTFLEGNFPNATKQLLEVLTADYKKTIAFPLLEGKKIQRAQIEQNYPNPNMILYGPPGTGKTFASMDMAIEIVGKVGTTTEENRQIFKQHLGKQIEWVTFHQNYTYEDFIQGLRPVTSNRQSLQFELKDGIFKRIAQRALLNYLSAKTLLNEKDYQLKTLLQDQPSTVAKNWAYSLNEAATPYGRQAEIGLQNYVLLIDEINRANISSVFGELIALLEKDKRYDSLNEMLVTLPSGEPFVVPPNLYLIGTMNTADKSIGLLDMALRRRFEFRAVYPRYDLTQLAHTEVLKKINQTLLKLRGRDFQIGHTYFLKDEQGVFDLTRTLNHQVIPLLYEYFRHDEDLVQRVLRDSGIDYETDWSGVRAIG